MCSTEKHSLQRGMYFNLHKRQNIFLMSLRPNAPYADMVEDGGRTLIYEGHDEPKSDSISDPKLIDQPMYRNGNLSENGKFYNSAISYKNGKAEPIIVKVYEKIKPGMWAYNGLFKLIDSWRVNDGKRFVFKFRLSIIEQNLDIEQDNDDVPRIIPTDVKIKVWNRDKGKCVKCGSTENLHFDHIIPYSRGGSSLTEKNIQILCARCNIEKRDNIE
ncbi:MAG: HNH endonuclease [Methanomassiliicoccales archaeon PtaU1.Bin124]|nr:MAG: HNH endonuclease [Methanomassiliicoccales archaeon PtaU1.Bin124]